MMDFSSWRQQIKRWREKYDEPQITWPGINPYQLVKEIGKWTTKDDVIVSDTGTALGYLMQAFPFKGERFLHAFNMTPMGYGLPAAISASFALPQHRVILITGDGSFMMSLAELATVARWNLNIKIILLNNGQHSMCVQTERQWFGGRNASTTVPSGLSFPNWANVPAAFNIRPAATIAHMFLDDQPAWHEVKIHADAILIPQCRFGYPLEDAEPALSREELAQQMIIPLLETA